MPSRNRHRETLRRTTPTTGPGAASSGDRGATPTTATSTPTPTRPATGRARFASRRCAASAAASSGVVIRRGPVAGLVGVGVLVAVVGVAPLSPDDAAPGPVVGVVRRSVSRWRFRLGMKASDRLSPGRGAGPRVPPTGDTRWRIGAGSAGGRAAQQLPGEPVDEVAD